MRKYLQAYQELFQCDIIPDDNVRRFVDTHLVIDQYLPDSAAFFYIVKFPDGRYNFLGNQQEHVSGYTNEEFKAAGVELFLQCIDPEQIGFILQGVYPDMLAFVSALPDDETKKKVLIQYNYRFRRKDGQFINLLEHVHILELDSAGRPAIVMGNVIMLQHTDSSPVRLTIKQLNGEGVSETVLNKVYSPLQTKQHISNREMEILRHLATGKSSREIGRQLFISPHTVDTHRRRLLKKTGSSSVVELTRIAFRNNLL